MTTKIKYLGKDISYKEIATSIVDRAMNLNPTIPEEARNMLVKEEMYKDGFSKDKMKLAFFYAWQRCDSSVSNDAVVKLAQQIYHNEITDWDVMDDEHDLTDNESCLFNI